MLNRTIARGVLGMAVLMAASGTSSGDMVLTAAGSSAGFGLSTFADGFPTNGGVGPVGIAFTPTGGVIISSYAAGNNAVFAYDTDGQHLSGATLSSGASLGGGNSPAGIAQVGGNYYQGLQSGNAVVQINSSGNFVQTIALIPFATGVVANSTNGHLFVSGSSSPGASVFDVDPIAKTHIVFAAVPFDGMTITADGRTLYGADPFNGHLYGYDTTTKALVFDSGVIPGVIDGIALGTRSLAGNIFVNTNTGTLVEVNLMSLTQTVIGIGGSRGDFVEADPNNGSLLLTQSDSVLRLTAPSGGGFTPTPAPYSLVMSSVLIGVLAVVWSYRRMKRTKAAI